MDMPAFEQLFTLGTNFFSRVRARRIIGMVLIMRGGFGAGRGINISSQETHTGRRRHHTGATAGRGC